MTLKTTVIIPVVQTKLADDLIHQMNQNTLLPERIIVIDNSDSGFYPVEEKVPITRVRPPTLMTVNESWNFGIGLAIEEKSDLVSIFNDDIIIRPNLFRIHFRHHGKILGLWSGMSRDDL